MTTEHEATRTLVKSPPELWAECSDAGSLARHLGEFGEIRITRLEPETTVAWEGESASGTVRIEPSGWGTRVTLTAQRSVDETPPEPEPEPVQAEPADPAADEVTDQSIQEVSDATPEETPEAEDPALEADVGRIRWRWRRVSARVRGAFAREEGESAAPPDAPEEPVESVPPPEPGPAAEVAPAELVVTPDAPSPAPPEAEETSEEPQLDADAVLTAALDSLGQAHHRPFSRA